jgi:alpha-tubulin suppressor-like RCC1 family protein
MTSRGFGGAFIGPCLVISLAACGSQNVDWGTFPLEAAPEHRLSAGAGHTCAVAADGTVYCWGSNPDGQLGDGLETIERACPGPVKGVTRAVAVSAGSYHACALDAAGAVYCWGWNVAGQIGDGSILNALTAKKVMGLESVVAIAAGSYHTCALLADGSARCWGQNDAGQLGDGSSDNRGEPVEVFSLPRASAIAAGGKHSCALVSGTGEVQCWGLNDFGELGDGTLAAHPFPSPASGVSGALSIAAGFNHTCALLETGGVTCWGANAAGQLGNDSYIDSPLPVVALGPPAAILTCGYRHTCVIGEDGAVSCWGVNDAGQLGDGTRLSRGVGKPVVPLAPASGIAGGGFHTCARTEDGAIRCWGANESGQLGIPDSASEPSPISISRPGCWTGID